jgi:hypothetical protein
MPTLVLIHVAFCTSPLEHHVATVPKLLCIVDLVNKQLDSASLCDDTDGAISSALKIDLIRYRTATSLRRHCHNASFERLLRPLSVLATVSWLYCTEIRNLGQQQDEEREGIYMWAWQPKQKKHFQPSNSLKASKQQPALQLSQIFGFQLFEDPIPQKTWRTPTQMSCTITTIPYCGQQSPLAPYSQSAASSTPTK